MLYDKHFRAYIDGVEHLYLLMAVQCFYSMTKFDHKTLIVTSYFLLQTSQAL